MLDFSFVCCVTLNKSFNPGSWFLMYKVGTRAETLESCKYFCCIHSLTFWFVHSSALELLEVKACVLSISKFWMPNKYPTNGRHSVNDLWSLSNICHNNNSDFLFRGNASFFFSFLTWETCTLFYKVPAPIYNFICSTQEFPLSTLSPIPVISCLFDNSHSENVGYNSSRFWFLFPWWLKMLISDVIFHSPLLLLVFSQHLTLKQWLYIIYLLIYLFIVPFLLEYKLHEGRNLILFSAVSPAPRKGSGFIYIRLLLLLSCVQLFVTSWTVACQAPLSSTLSQSLLKFMSTELVMLSNHLILCYPLLLLPSIFPCIRVFSNKSALRPR